MKLKKNEIHLWYTYANQTVGQQQLSDYATILSTEETYRHQAFYFEKDRHQFLVTRALLRTVLSKYDNTVRPDEWLFDKNDYGKPYIAHKALTPLLYFNLSHTDGLAVLAVTQAEEVGVDVEHINRVGDSHQSIANHFFSRSEYQELARLPSDQQAERFITLWTLKEAYIKAKGMGLSIPLDQFSFSFVDAENVEITFKNVDDQSQDNQFWNFWSMSLGNGYKLAVGLESSYKKNDYSISQINYVPSINL